MFLYQFLNSRRGAFDGQGSVVCACRFRCDYEFFGKEITTQSIGECKGKIPVAQGAADQAIVELAHLIRLNHGHVEGILGVSSARHGYEPVSNRRRPLSNIDETPQVPWDLFPLARYVAHDGCLSHYKSRGCPGRCRFCGVPRLYPAVWSGYSAERVIADLDYFVRQHRVRIVKLQDVDVFADATRMKAICQGIIKRNLKIRWIADLRVAKAVAFDEELWALLKDSGCAELELGAETGSEDQLEEIYKECDRAEIFDVVEKIVGCGIFARVNFVLEFPEETLSHLNDTLTLIRQLGDLGEFVRFQFYRFEPKILKLMGCRLPKSREFEWAENEAEARLKRAPIQAEEITPAVVSG